MKQKIYIVEDDQDIQHLLKTSLTKAGFDITVFSNGYPVIEMTDNWPDLFLLDIELPGINGLEICKWVKEHDGSRDIPVIFLSAAPYLRVLAENVNADDYLEKPFDSTTLIQKINNSLMTNTVQA